MADDDLRRDVNVATLRGKLMDAPAIRDTKNGRVCRFRLCTTRNSKIRGEWKNFAQYHSIITFEPEHIVVAEELAKDDRVQLTGEITLNKWTTAEGVERKDTQINVGRFHTLVLVGDAAEKPRAAQTPKTPGGGNIDDLSDTIPFSPCWQ